MLRTPQKQTFKKTVAVAVVTAVLVAIDMLVTASVLYFCAQYTLEKWTSLEMSFPAAFWIVLLMRVLNHDLKSKENT